MRDYLKVYKRYLKVILAFLIVITIFSAFASTESIQILLRYNFTYIWYYFYRLPPVNSKKI